jgi:hypothetical protein
VSEAKLGRIHPRGTILADATRVYSKTITAKEGTASELRRGWSFIPLIKPKEERESVASPPARQPPARRLRFGIVPKGLVLSSNRITS